MAKIHNIGRAQGVTYSGTIVIGGTIIAAETFWVEINKKRVTVAATNTSASTTAGLLQAALDASTIAEFTEVTWTVNGATITATGVTAGNEIIFSVDTDSASGTITPTELIAATGPNDWNNADNWSGGAVPGNGDDVTIDRRALSSITMGLDQSAVTLASLYVYQNFDQQTIIGLPDQNAAGYAEHRDKTLVIGVVDLQVGIGDGNGCGFIRISPTNSTLVNQIHKTGQPVISGIPAVQISGTHASSVHEVKSGSAGFGVGGASGSAASISVSAEATVFIGPEYAVATLDSGGVTETYGGITTLKVYDGETTGINPTPPTTTTITGGTCNYQYGGTCTNTTITNALLDCSGDNTARTFTNTTLGIGGRIFDPKETITYTNKIGKATGVREMIAA